MKATIITLPGEKPMDSQFAKMRREFEAGLVSVILPAYNREKFVGNAISSVWEQTYRPVELLIVDDGSQDHTEKVVREVIEAWPDEPGFRVVYIRQPNRGASAARNQGLIHSNGEFIQYLDSDDVLVNHKLARHVCLLRSNEALDIVWSDWWVVDSELMPRKLQEGNRMSLPPPGEVFQSTEKRIPWEPWPTLTRRRFVVEHAAWNEKTSRWDDWEYALRIMASKPRRAYAPGIGCIQRAHNQGRRQDLDDDPRGIEKGLVAAREAGAFRDRALSFDPILDQYVADRYWEIFIEALRHLHAAPAFESIKGACCYGRRLPFRTKVQFLKLFLGVAGIKATRALLFESYIRG
jgi:glycosyltransferase involved in cell wall biosynthesis